MYFFCNEISLEVVSEINTGSVLLVFDLLHHMHWSPCGLMGSGQLYEVH